MNTLVGTREGSPAVENTLAVALVAGAFHDAVVVLLLEGSHAAALVANANLGGSRCGRGDLLGCGVGTRAEFGVHALLGRADAIVGLRRGAGGRRGEG